MKNKYYNPKIEEFYVGFEYEIYDFERAIWGSYKVKQLDDLFDCPDSLTLEGHIDADYIRVKYLDKEDIESLGFNDYKKSVCEWYRLEGKFEDSFSNHGYWSKIRLVHCCSNHKIKIMAYEYSWDEEETILFQGSCKNKSEFSKILKQLNII